MELSAYAERLLAGTTLADKLLQPDVLTDERPGAVPLHLPDTPGRPLELRIPGKGQGAKIPMPSMSNMERPEIRGRVLHQFANHELLALELMALALLRFPDAPAKFRRGLAATIAEEQKHMRLYMERMTAYGVGFGEAPVSRFFWDALEAMPTPLAFCAQMSLTLEQANLDFSLYYRDLFTRLGDAETAAVLDLVFQEEIGHVRHGLAWFNRWRDPALSEWDAYVRALPPPLTPSRAKGLGFSAEARRAAGLGDAFIAELAVHNQSKGRPPTVFLFNPGCEDEVADGRPALTLPRQLRDLQTDLAILMAFLAKPSDVVIVPERPTTAFLATLAPLGFDPPQVVAHDAAKNTLKGRQIERFAPWGRTPAAAYQARKLGLAPREPSTLPPDPRVFAKTWAAETHRAVSPATCATVVCTSLTDLEATLATMTAAGPAVIKAPLGSSGRHMHKVGSGGLTPANRAWATRILAEQGAVVTEPWLDKVMDLSVQLETTAPDPVLGITRFVTDRRGQYIGHVIGRKLDDLADGDRRALFEGRIFERLSEVARGVAAALGRAGYAGPAGIDALLHRGAGGELLLRPIVEVNARFTMGRIALALEQRLAKGVRALWMHVTPKQAAALGHESLAVFAAELTRRHPPRFGTGGLLSGAIPTNDPALATSVVTLLAAGEAVDDLALLAYPDRDPNRDR